MTTIGLKSYIDSVLWKIVITMSKQVLEIEPLNELVFVGPFDTPVTTYMNLTNPTDNRVVYKIKTTAPKKYCVRPNSGILEPKNKVKIVIAFQPTAVESNEKVKHKFMVQSFIAPEGDLNIEQLWKELVPENLMDTKLRCVFKLPEDENKNTENIKPTKQTPVEKKVDTKPTNELSELQQLRHEESRLQKENFQLKEDLLRLKQKVHESSQFTNKYQPPPVQADINSSLYLGLAFAMGLIGIILGKFIF